MGQLKFFIFSKSESLGKTSQGGLVDANLSGRLGDRIHSKSLYVIKHIYGDFNLLRRSLILK